MRLNERFFFALAIGNLIVAAAIAVLVFDQSVTVFAAALAGLGIIGWVFFACMCFQQAKISRITIDTAKRLGFDAPGFSPATSLQALSKEIVRYHGAVSAFRAEGALRGNDLAANLRRITHLVYHELNATAVELSLYDEVSAQWSQALVIGAPRSVNSQAMLAAAIEGGERQILTSDENMVLVMPVEFAGTVFGAVRVELSERRRATKNEMILLRILATEGALMLVNSRFTEELLRMRRAGDETIRAKTGFLANLSHEIRGPLGIILNGVELTLDGLCGPVSEQQHKTLNMVKQSGDHLLDLVNDVLDYAKVEAGKIIPKIVQIPLKDLLEDLCNVIRSQASDKGLALELTEVDRALGVLCDKRHARQMLINLLTNAVKYTPTGGTITVSAARSSGNRVKIIVKDTGIGIAENQRDKVFAAFERVDDQYALSQVGTGLGMPLTRRLAEVNGGNVDFDSKVGEGSSFWVVLPAVEIEQSGIAASDASSIQLLPQGKGELILIIDHDAHTLEMLGTYLGQQGFAIVQAKSGKEVFKILRERPIDIAVVENDLPDLPGEEMVAAIRSNPHAAAVPIILLSARAFVFDIERFLKLGVDRCLSKPVTLSELAVTARRLIDETKNYTETNQ